MLLRKILYLVLFFGINTISWASDPPKLISYPPNQIMGFRGLDTRSTSPTLADSRAEDLLNVKLSSALDLRKRSGYDTVNDTLDELDTSDAPITGIFDTKFSTGESWTLAFYDYKLKYDNSGTWSTVGGSGTITSGKNYQWQCIMALDSAVCTDDQDPILKISKTPTKSPLSLSGLSSSVTKAKTLTWFRNFLILGNTVEGGSERPTRFRWSNVGTIETWTDDDFVDMATFAGDEIIGFTELYGDLYIFMTKSIWRASYVGGDDIFVFSKVIDGIGAISRDSIQTVQLSDQRSAVIFLDFRKRVLMFNGATVTDIGNIIQASLDDLLASRLPYAVATFDGKSYYLSATTSAQSHNDIVYEYQTEIGEWTKHDNINANAFAQVEETSGSVKTYFGNYDSFVYWLDNPDLYSDVAGASGIIDSVGVLDTAISTGGQAIIDTDIDTGVFAGAIIEITSGTGAGQQAVIATGITTGVVLETPFTTTPDSTSVYTIGKIDSYYNGKHYELGDAAREKSAFLGVLIWAEEASDNSVDVSYAIDFGNDIDSETLSLSPQSDSLWDTALWDVATWGTTGDKIYTVKMSGYGNTIEPKFANDSIDQSFHLYGFNIIATSGDIKSP